MAQLAVTAVLAASAILAFLRDEPGSERVEPALAGAAACSAVNWSEVAAKVRAAGADWPVAVALLDGYGLTVVDATRLDAEQAAGRWSPRTPMSLGDRFCLALADRLDVDAWTADTAWGTSGRVRQIR